LVFFVLVLSIVAGEKITFYPVRNAPLASLDIKYLRGKEAREKSHEKIF
jgi:hypothetical protein